ncbi:hypothetical protein FORC066_2128 [Yersinia enterocolitica]|nr:hypothetical protein FORC066_2128 [Yersinia enterocolitica]
MVIAEYKTNKINISNMAIIHAVNRDNKRYFQSFFCISRFK